MWMFWRLRMSVPSHICVKHFAFPHSLVLRRRWRRPPHVPYHRLIQCVIRASSER